MIKTLTFSTITILMTLCLTHCSVLGIRTGEQASYRSIHDQGSFQIRQYSNYLSAETVVSSQDWDEASTTGFRRLAGYIFGKNKQKQDIAMTSPVLISPTVDTSQKIDMTSPVFAEKTAMGWKMSFVLPQKLNINNAPAPLDNEVTLRERTGKKFATVRFSGVLSDNKFSQYSEKLRSWMQEEKLQAISKPLLAGYDPPWTLPFLRRNEVLIEIN